MIAKIIAISLLIVNFVAMVYHFQSIGADISFLFATLHAAIVVVMVFLVAELFAKKI